VSRRPALDRLFDRAGQVPALAARGLIRGYRYSLSSLMGRRCRYLPTCSEFTEDAIARHGLWAGGWMGLARVCSCRPGGGSGFDPPPDHAPAGARPWTPWRYGRWGLRRD
jgi:putative membrane protein insertion efficiency factor